MPQRLVIRTGCWAKRLGRGPQRCSLLSSCSGCPCCSPVLGCLQPRNLLSALTLVLCAIAVSGGVEMILELEQPFAGVLHILPVPMHRTVDSLNEANSPI